MKKTILYLIIGLLLVSTNHGYVTSTTFDDATSTFNLTSNTTKTISLPSNVVLQNASVDIIGYYGVRNNQCMQESTSFLQGENCTKVNNTLTKPDYNLSGDYSPTSADAYYVNDTHWETMVKCQSAGLTLGTCNIRTIYGIPSDATNQSKVILKLGEGSNVTHTIPPVCLNQTQLTLLYVFQYVNALGGMRYTITCIGNGTSTNRIYQSGYDYAYYIYEEAVIWDFAPIRPNNTAVIVNNSNVFSYIPELSSRRRVYLNSSGQLDYCLRSAQPCNISFGLVGGVLGVENLSINYSYVLNANIYDEMTDLRITDPINVEIIGATQGFYHNYTTTTGYLNISNMPVDTYKITYGGTGWSYRSYYVTTGSTTQNIDLFDIESNTSTYVVVNAVDERGNPIVGGYVKLMAFFINRGVSMPVEVEKTDNNGNAPFYLKLSDKTYTWIVTDAAGNIIFQSEETKVVSNNVYLRANVNTNAYQDLNKNFGISGGITFDNSTFILSYVWNNPDGTPVTGCINVSQSINRQLTQLYSTCSDAAIGSININLTGVIQNNTYYYAIGTVRQGTTENIISAWEYNYNSTAKTFGQMGLFIGIIIIITFFFAGITQNFSIALGYSTLALFFLNFLQFTALGNGFIAIFCIAGLIIAVKNKI